MIVVHAGNQVDAPDRPEPRFPTAQVDRVAGRLGQLLDLVRPDAVVTSAAAGADLLLARAALDRGIPLHVVLPFPVDRFRALSVASAGERWTAWFDDVVAAVESGRGSLVELALPEDDDGYRAANAALVARAVADGPGDAANRALAVAVRPPPDPDRPSVTDDFAARAVAAGLFLVDLDPRPHRR